MLGPVCEAMNLNHVKKMDGVIKDGRSRSQIGAFLRERVCFWLLDSCSNLQSDWNNMYFDKSDMVLRVETQAALVRLVSLCPNPNIHVKAKKKCLAFNESSLPYYIWVSKLRWFER